MQKRYVLTLDYFKYYFETIEIARSFVSQVDPNGEMACVMYDIVDDYRFNLRIPEKNATAEVDWQKEGF